MDGSLKISSSLPLKLHLGCGQRFLEGYQHVDLADFPHIDHRTDVRHLPMFADNCADIIYTSHQFAYSDRFEAPLVLAEWRRVLKPGGTLRIAVPDFEGLVKVYQTYGDLSLILGPMYGRWAVPGSDEVIYEKTVYDRASLTRLLEEHGFEHVRPWNWRTAMPSGYDDHAQAYYPHMHKDTGIHVSLNLEADKTH